MDALECMTVKLQDATEDTADVFDSYKTPPIEFRFES